MTTISITRALVELKRLDARINHAISSGLFVAQTQGTDTNRKVVNSRDSIADTTAKINASFQSVESLIANRKAIKAAIVASNATTVVTLGDQTMTVAEAIDLKGTLEYHEKYLSVMRSQLVRNKADVEAQNSKLETEIQASLNALLGGDKKTHDKATIDMVTNAQKGQRERQLLGDALVENKIKAQEELVLNIKSELDFVLSESNALTQITVSL